MEQANTLCQGSGVQAPARRHALVFGYYERNGAMKRIVATALFLMLLVCACETTTPKGKSQEEKANGPIEVTIGGEVRVQGEYRDSD